METLRKHLKGLENCEIPWVNSSFKAIRSGRVQAVLTCEGRGRDRHISSQAFNLTL